VRCASSRSVSQAAARRPQQPRGRQGAAAAPRSPEPPATAFPGSLVRKRLGEALLPEPGDVPEDDGAELGKRAVGAVVEHPQDGLSLRNGEPEELDLVPVGVLELLGLGVEASSAKLSGEIEDVAVRDADAAEEHGPILTEHLFAFKGAEGLAALEQRTAPSTRRCARSP
jgi:hypothetical protein